ncbi:MAG: GTP-binding protein [Gammaproteobacteria bacterium]
MGVGQAIHAVPTNIITGFLGVGKTSAILNFLKQKPADERWAVLVNEFGEIGVDGSLVQGQLGTPNTVFIKEVPGGCMCCTAGLPMQIALNQLLRQAKPDRLLIEPTGLGHALEVLETLSSDFNRDVLALQRTVTLVDARNLSKERYLSHPTFLQQLDVADVIVGNKADRYTAADRAALEAYVNEHCTPGVQVVLTEHGELPLSSLEGAPARQPPARQAHSHDAVPVLAADLSFPENGVITATNKGEGFESIGWRFSPDNVFDRMRLYSFLTGLVVERMKAVFITNTGTFGYNLTRDALTEIPLEDSDESRIEIIAQRIDSDWDGDLSLCLA